MTGNAPSTAYVQIHICYLRCHPAGMMDEVHQQTISDDIAAYTCECLYMRRRHRNPLTRSNGPLYSNTVIGTLAVDG